MSVTKFNDGYLDKLLDKLSTENKTIFLLGDFHINLLKYNTRSPTNELLDSLSSHFLLPKILQSTRLKYNLKTLTDNIFSSMAAPNIISGNLTAPIFHHLPQFLFGPKMFFHFLISQIQ